MIGLDRVTMGPLETLAYDKSGTAVADLDGDGTADVLIHDATYKGGKPGQSSVTLLNEGWSGTALMNLTRRFGTLDSKGATADETRQAQGFLNAARDLAKKHLRDLSVFLNSVDPSTLLTPHFSEQPSIVVCGDHDLNPCQTESGKRIVSIRTQEPESDSSFCAHVTHVDGRLKTFSLLVRDRGEDAQFSLEGTDMAHQVARQLDDLVERAKGEL